MPRTFAILGRSSNAADLAAEGASATPTGSDARPTAAWHGSWTLGVVVDDIGEEAVMLKFLGTTMGIIFLIGLLVVIGLFALIF